MVKKVLTKPGKPGERINIYIPAQLVKEARAYAAAQDRSLSNLIAHLLRTDMESSIWWESRRRSPKRGPEA